MPAEAVVCAACAIDSKGESAVPYTVLLAPGGKVLYQKQGSVDILELRRKILSNNAGLGWRKRVGVEPLSVLQTEESGSLRIAF
jgi:hypothetical protein